MANYYGTARSNYFKVKDKNKFVDEFINVFSLSLIKDDENRVGFIVQTEDGAIPANITDDNNNDINFDDELAKHLVEGEVAVYQEVGYEKMRYLTGYSTAVNSKGETVTVSINDIYRLAQEELGGENITECEF